MRPVVRECAAGRVLPRREIRPLPGETPLEYPAFRDDWRKRRISRAFSSGINRAREKVTVAVPFLMIAAMAVSSATSARRAESTQLATDPNLKTKISSKRDGV